ncbi:MAG: hypothetical protein ACYCUX_03040 [Metallibacterium sp.]
MAASLLVLASALRSACCSRSTRPPPQNPFQAGGGCRIAAAERERFDLSGIAIVDSTTHNFQMLRRDVHRGKHYCDHPRGHPMKRNRLFLALTMCFGLAAAGPVLAAPAHKRSADQALRAMIDKQQKQLDQQQQDLQMLRDKLKQMESEQAQQQTQIQAQASAPPAPAPKLEKQVFSSGPGVSVSMHGWVDATFFHQDKSFIYGNGQNAEYPQPGTTGSLSGGDVRNTRFWFDFAGPALANGWTGGGHLEMDFFGGFNGAGPYSQEQATPRLRQAYIVLANPGNGSTIQIGQQWDLMIGLDNIPVSLSHIAFPLGLGAGLIGWRFPGVVWMQDLNHGATGPQWRLDLGVFQGQWNGPGNDVNYLTAGNAGFKPQLEARLHVQDKDWLAYAVVHYSQVSLSGVGGTAPTPIASGINTEAFEVGASWHPGPWLFHGNLYSGKGLGQMFGTMTQFGNIKETGGWLQVGYNLTPHWSANAFYAYGKPNTHDVITWMGHGSSGYLENRQAVASLLYNDGPYGLGIEWLHDWLNYTTTGLNRNSISGNQMNFSAIYHF